MGTLEITMFGTLRVQRPSRPVLQFPTRRVKDLFSYLLINRHTIHSREALAELLWGDANERNPRHCLNTALWRLNRVLGEADAGEHPYLRVDAQHISFNTASDSRLDIAEFENRCLWAEQIGVQAPDQQAAFYHQAVDLYQADLLVDCYGEWCLVERERLQRIYLNGLDFLVDYHAAREEYREAIDCAARLLACDSLREDVHRKLIEFYLATSQPAAALRQYRECEEVLRRELGTSPAPETQVMLPQIFRAGQRLPGAAGVVPAPVAESPPPADRTEALASAVNRLREAVTDFDRAHAQLKAAAMAVEGLASPLLQAATPSIDGVREGDDGQLAASVLSEMEQVIALATGAAQRLAVTSPAHGR